MKLLPEFAFRTTEFPSPQNDAKCASKDELGALPSAELQPDAARPAVPVAADPGKRGTDSCTASPAANSTGLGLPETSF